MTREQLIRNVVRLRRTARSLPGDEDLASVRADLERAIGPTVSRAVAARLLCISQTGLDRWVATGDVPVVLTPTGRREIPLTALVELVEAIDERRERGERRPLARVLRARRALRPPSDRRERGRPEGHRTAEQRGLAYHEAVAQRLDDDAVAEARARLRRWRAEGRIHPRYADAWQDLLAGPREQLLAALRADDDHAASLRQSSPFAGMLGERERRTLLDLPDDAAA